MTENALTERLSKLRQLYERQRAASRLAAHREKSLLELGHVAHAKLQAGDISDPELGRISQAVGNWDRMLQELHGAEGRASGTEAPASDSVGSDRGRKGAASLPDKLWTAARPVWKHGGFGALLSVVLLLALCLAIVTVGNRALNQGADIGRTAIAEQVQGAVGQVQEKLGETGQERLNGPLGERISGGIRDALESKLSAVTDLRSGIDFNLLKVPTTYLLVHNVESKAELNTGGGLVASELRVQSGVYAFLLVPLLAFLIGGYVAARRMRVQTAKQAAGLALVIGAVNAIVLALMTTLSGFSAEADLPGRVGSIGIDYSFSFFGALRNGFLLGALFGFAGAMLRLSSFRWARHLHGGIIPYGEPIRRAAATVAYGLGISLLYSLAVLWGTGAPSPLLVWLLPQVAFYVWGIANGNVFHMTNLLAGQGRQLEVSVFAGIQGTGTGEAAAAWNGFIAASVLIPIVLLLLAGMRMKMNSGRSSQTAAVFGLVYAGLLSVLAMLLRIGVTATGSSALFNTKSIAMTAGFTVPGVFMTSFVAAYVLVSIGLRWSFGRRSKLNSKGTSPLQELSGDRPPMQPPIQ
ncbi:hypothetical protein [Cohnella fermenti]|uniref:Uncharacterized protein n=1 Tax=Cohnella fermenti TaxID=2565925 RepID=A0A4S4CAR3_9BACL|nr:hypothetical protein [Cohnella fermenti]THF84523.1 hypothetical protein E6C55_00640 [Cohnella fermenti]